MSQPDLNSNEPRGVLVRRPRTSIYTVLLLLALVAMAISCLLLVLEWAAYDFQWEPPVNLRSATPAAASGVLVC